MSGRHLHPESRALLALLAALVALGPLSVDMYLPAMPMMVDALDTQISRMHLTLSAYLTGFALFHLACGPLADRFGRKPILLGGTGLFVIASLGCVLSTNVEQLIACRFVQGVGACVGPTLGRTIARDLFGPTRAARALSVIAMLMALAPAIAPALGSVLLLWLPWQSIFVFLGVYAMATIVLVLRYLAESLPAPQSLHPRTIVRNFGELISHRGFMIAAIASGCIYAALMVYLSCSSFVYIDMLGVPQQYFGGIFLTTVMGYMMGSAISARLSTTLVAEPMVMLGATMTSLATVLMLAAHTLWPHSAIAIAAPTVFYSAGMGLLLPNAMAFALRQFAHTAGTASALLGFIQMSLSAVATAVVGKYLVDTPQPMLLFMITLVGMALVLAFTLYYQYRGQLVTQ